MASLGLLLASITGAAALAQDDGIYAPLTWTRGDVEIENSAAKPTLTPPPSPSLASIASPRDVTRYGALIETVAREHNLDPHLLHAMIHVESRYQQEARSNKGAVGLMQVMPLTGARFGYTDLSNAPDNLRAGAAYLKWLLNHFDDNLELSIAAYNAGEGAVKKYGQQIPPYPETQAYVTQVIARYRENPMTFSAPGRSPQPMARATEKPSKVLHSAAAFFQTVMTLLTSPEHNDG